MLKIQLIDSHFPPLYAADKLPYRFKYIPCYHLSTSGTDTTGLFRDSNTSHVIIYRKPRIPYLCLVVIQIHPMLSFIENQLTIMQCMTYSNTSHVIIYQVGGAYGYKQ